MIVGLERDRYVLVTQPDHAALAADLLAAWPPLAGVSDRNLLLRATRLHDNGWQELDSSPQVDDRGRPVDYRGQPAAARRRLWRRGIERYRASDPECALLIVEHAIELHRRLAVDPEIERLLEEARVTQAALIDELGERATEVIALYPWLALTDTLSLMSCDRWRSTVSVEQPGLHEPLKATLVEQRGLLIGLHPFPLAGATTFHMAARSIEQRRYRSDSDLAVALAASRWQTRSLRLESAAPA